MQMVDQVLADRTQKPAGQSTLPTMPDDDEVRADLPCDSAYPLRRIAYLEPRSRLEAQRVQPARTFGEDLLINLALAVQHGHGRSFHRHPRREIDDGKKNDIGSANLGDAGALAQRKPAFYRPIVSEEDLSIHSAPLKAQRARSAAGPCSSRKLT